MKRLNFKKKYVAGALAAGLIMGAGGIAAAYFTATGTGTGNARVGHATPFTVTQNGVPAYLYPGKTVTTSFNIVNTGGGVQHFTARVVVDHTAGGTIITAFQTTPNREAVHGCNYAWFTTGITNGPSGTLNPGASYTLDVNVTMTNVATTQNACQTTSPKLTVSSGGPAGFALFDGEGGVASWTSPTTALLHIPANSPTYISTATAVGASAGIELLNPPALLPTNAPTFTSTEHGGGSPRWVIETTTGAHLFGYTTGAWTGTGVAYTTNWTAVKTEFGARHVKDAFIVSTTGQPTPFTDTITNVTYGKASF